VLQGGWYSSTHEHRRLFEFVQCDSNHGSSHALLPYIRRSTLGDTRFYLKRMARAGKTYDGGTPIHLLGGIK